MDKWDRLKNQLKGLRKAYKEIEDNGYTVVGTKAVEAVQRMMEELESEVEE